MKSYQKFSLFCTFTTMAVIFFISSLSFGTAGKTSYLSIVYHFLIFSLLSFFLLTSVCFKKIGVFVILVFSFVYACLDELHQYFVPGRSCNLLDILVDFLGIIFGFILTYLFLAIVEKYS